MTQTFVDAASDPVQPLKSAPAPPAAVRLTDTTMLYAPKSGGVKRYLRAKHVWLAANRPQVRHTLVVPGPKRPVRADGEVSIYAYPLPFGDGYRWPTSKAAWTDKLVRQNPHLIEAGDPYTPGLAALRAGQKLGAPVVGFCHTDLPALAALHFGDWTQGPVAGRWAAIYSQFDHVFTPSRYMARRLAEAGGPMAQALPLGVDVQVFNPDRGDRAALRRMLGLGSRERLLVFAGRPAKEKRLDVLVEAVERLGDPYRLLVIGAGASIMPSDRVLTLDYRRDPAELAAVLAGCDAFVHANDAEPFGLIVLEAMACGLPVAGVDAGGVAESVDADVGALARGSTPAAMAEAIESIFARGAQSLGAEARRRAVARHGWNAVFEALTAAYARISGEAGFASARPALTH